jgi:hypothetical protein
MATDITMGIAPKIPTQRHWDWQHCLTAMSVLDKNFKMTKILQPKNGAKRIRTADPLNAIEVRYQLRYNPT